MQTTTKRNPIDYRVDDTTYNVLSALNEKLEGIDPEVDSGELFRSPAEADA